MIVLLEADERSTNRKGATMQDEMCNTTPRRIWTRPQIDQMLMTNDKAVERAMITLFKLQTSDEQRAASTNHNNGCGFNMTSATVGTRFARWLQGMDDNNIVRYPCKSLNDEKADYVFRKYCKNHASVMERARQIALTHSQQLVDVANGTLVVAVQIATRAKP